MRELIRDLIRVSVFILLISVSAYKIGYHYGSIKADKKECDDAFVRGNFYGMLSRDKETDSVSVRNKFNKYRDEYCKRE